MRPKKTSAEKPMKAADRIRAENAAAKAGKASSWDDFWAKRVVHITRGENKDGTPVGYHTKLFAGNGAVCKTFGEPVMIPKGAGCYTQWVAVLSNDNPEVGNKTKESTFFPDHWSEDDIENVCRSAFMAAAGQDTSKNFIAEATAAPGVGMKICFNPDSAFPIFIKK